jgi:MFS family permease
VLGNPYLRGIAGSTALGNLFNNIAMSTFIVYAVRELGMGAAQIGLVFGLGNIGAIAGALSADRVRRTLGLGRAIMVSVLVEGPALVLIALAPASAPIPFLLASGLINGFGIVVYNINQLSFRQAITPTAMQGRMNATMRFIVWGTIPVGQIVGGIIATTVSLHAAIWVGAIGAFVSVVPLLITPVHTLREMPTPVDDGPAAPAERNPADGFDDLETPQPGHGGLS